MAQITGGAALHATLNDLARKLGGPTRVLGVGFLEGATYPDGTSVAMVAAVQNFGSARVPPRPFFSNMVREKSPAWGEKLARILEQNGNDANAAMHLMGEGIKGQLQQSIRDTNSPPLAESTIARKGFAKPLIDTSNMINSVDYEVTE